VIVFYVSIRTNENYEFDKIRTAGVTVNATIKTARATIPYVQPEMKLRSPPGQFHLEPPLVAKAGISSSCSLRASARQKINILYCITL